MNRGLTMSAARREAVKLWTTLENNTSRGNAVMSDAAMNPYASSNFEPAKSAGPSKRPVGLLIIGVVILVLASMGFMGSIFGAVMLAVNGGKVDYKQQLGSQPNVEVNPEAMAKLQDFAPSHSAKNIGITIAGLVVSILLVLGSIGAIYPFKWGPGLLSIGCIAAVFFLIAQGVIVMMIMNDIVGVMNAYPDNFFSPKGDVDDRAVEMMGTVMRITYTVIPIVTWILNAAKSIFYVAVVAYLRKKNVREFVQGAGA
jgi:hypothetical protein